MEKTITFNIPKGYVIDKENSTDSNIVLKLVEPSKPKTWEEYCKKMEGKSSYVFTDSTNKICSSRFIGEPFLAQFEDKEDIEAFVALSKLLKLRKEWIGDWKFNWSNDSKKYIICNYAGAVIKDILFNTAHCLSFPTPEMRDEFFDCFKDYIEQAKTLI